MHAFDEEERLVKFATVEEVIQRFISVRLKFYVDRKKHKIGELEKLTRKLSNIARFITEILDDAIDLRRKKSDEVSAILKERGYDTTTTTQDEGSSGSYNYLVKLPMDSVTIENVEKIIKERDEKLAELATLQATSEEQLWINELNHLREKYLDSKKNAGNENENSSGETVKKVIKKKKMVVVDKS
jgi:DNA topoisomerase-2